MGRGEGIGLALPALRGRIKAVGVVAATPTRVKGVGAKGTEFVDTGDVLEGAVGMARTGLPFVGLAVRIGIVAGGFNAGLPVHTDRGIGQAFPAQRGHVEGENLIAAIITMPTAKDKQAIAFGVVGAATPGEIMDCTPEDP